MHGYLSFLSDSVVILIAVTTFATALAIFHIHKTQIEKEERLAKWEKRLQAATAAAAAPTQQGNSDPSSALAGMVGHHDAPVIQAEGDGKEARIRQLAAEGASVTAIARAVYGHANKFYNDKVRDILAHERDNGGEL